MGRDAVRNIVIQNLIQRRTYSLLASIPMLSCQITGLDRKQEQASSAIPIGIGANCRYVDTSLPGTATGTG
ncbi:hypothetical protein AD428_02475 [Achromobacter sp. DMS1]|nr:hypothetical protein AD428_02475 [Achromobacter sp. DMS1]